MLAEHWQAVKAIYENGMATGMATFQTEAPEWADWDKAHLDIGRLVVVMDDEIVGWAALSPVSARYVYRGVAEVSIYVADTHRGRGIGKKLLQHLIAGSEANGIWTLQSGIFRENTASIKLHESVGFRIIGYREKIGKLHGQWKDNVILERRSAVVGGA